MMKNIVNNEKGVVSIVEIMTIVAVLGILISASIATFLGARDRTLIRNSCSMLHNIRQCLETYKIEKPTYPGGISDFQTLYTTLSRYGLEANPETEFARTGGFVSYSVSTSGYTLVVRARDRSRVVLTATRSGIDAGIYSDLVR